METTTSTPVSTSEDKTVAIIAYITIIGFIAAAIMNSSKKTKLGAFHLRQVLGMIVTGFAAGIVMIIPILGWIIGIVAMIAMILLLIAWIMGLISAINGQMKPAPVLGAYWQKWFGTTFE